MEQAQLHAELITVLYKCILIFGISGLIVPLFNRIHVSPILGFLLCGVLISPNLLNPAENDFGFLNKVLFVEEDNIRLLGELGVLALLFMIGLELSFEKLAEMKKYIFGLGMAQIVGTGIVIGAIAYLFENSLETAIVIGVGFALSSTAIVMQLLKDYGLSKQSVGKISFSILLMQDLAVVPILIMIGAFSSAGEGSSPTPLLVIYSLALAILVVGSIYIIGSRFLQPVLHKLIGTKKNEWLASFSLLVLCIIAMLTDAVGLSTALGAFLAGLLIAETEFRDKVEHILEPVKSILLGIFFISIGMMVDIYEIMSTPILLAISVVGIVAIKGFCIYPFCRVFKLKHEKAKEISLILCQPGEFTLMIISTSLAAGILPREDGQFFLLVCILGMFMAPFVFKFLPSTKKAIADQKNKSVSKVL